MLGVGDKMTKSRFKIIENIWQVGGDGLSGPGDAAIYLARFGEGAALIDAGCGDGHATVIRNIRDCIPDSVQIAYLFLTHCHFDHAGGAERLRADFGCKIVAHELDAVYLEQGDSEVTAASWYGARMNPLKVDIRLKGKENQIEVGDSFISAVHWPGHSPGSMILTTRMAGQYVVFAQDVHGPIHPALRSDENAYQMSLRALLDLKADILLEGHFGVYQGKETVSKFIQSFMSSNV